MLEDVEAVRMMFHWRERYLIAERLCGRRHPSVRSVERPSVARSRRLLSVVFVNENDNRLPNCCTLITSCRNKPNLE